MLLLLLLPPAAEAEAAAAAAAAAAALKRGLLDLELLSEREEDPGEQLLDPFSPCWPEDLASLSVRKCWSSLEWQVCSFNAS